MKVADLVYEKIKPLFTGDIQLVEVEYAKKYSESELDEAKKDLEHFKMMFSHIDNLRDFEIVEL